MSWVHSQISWAWRVGCRCVRHPCGWWCPTFRGCTQWSGCWWSVPWSADGPPSAPPLGSRTTSASVQINPQISRLQYNQGGQSANVKVTQIVNKASTISIHKLASRSKRTVKTGHCIQIIMFLICILKRVFTLQVSLFFPL